MNLEKKKPEPKDFPPERLSDDTKEVLRKIRLKKKTGVENNNKI